MATNRSAPPGIKALCVIKVLLNLLFLLAIVTTLGVGPIGIIAIMFVGTFVFIDFAIVWGLWTVKSWAWTGAMVLYTLGLLTSLLQLAVGDLVSGGFGLFVGLLIVGYVYSVRDVYKGQSASAQGTTAGY
ncbi:DUF2127 domain-containing protein [Haloarchaeobius sp. DFWS5]|uniref:DUF2127 domain-containing protein n=1 Tax=Haloarchaeobius sp. DFWS5 TaxID=3446114 RepID=UPI003EBB9464